MHLSQMVTKFKQICHNGTKTVIDLLFVSEPQLVRSYCIIPALSNSNHLGLHVDFNLKAASRAPKVCIFFKGS